ncbi:major facilitator superfamily transporter [Secundilactobacillus pentosiphilus]|uniref:Major facilitator superfamily transporter n=1 Tax=Secundilactobacillus pentosiphilus TaxID=1714682 RepID=A0A1Z5IRY0_9LACO|nr:multidrug efflux MFS transporter [Secundilactobacillus pentosiphilus]GAX04533.1 major facilitator superfamily transporter [Secundilactobacillus pentosiphilus]
MTEPEPAATKPQRPVWRRNLFVLWFGTFMAGLAFSEIMPFLSLYVDTLGNFTKDQLNLYSGITFSATYLVTAVASPMWGRLADRKGRKLMLLRASLGMAVVMGLMGAVTSVWELMALRFIQGIFSGYISNANALMATQAPKSKSGQALGTLSTGYVAGSLFGPLVGGVLAEIFSYRVTFFITGVLLLSVFFVSYFFVTESFTPVKKENMLSSKEVLGVVNHPRLILGMFITTLIIQASNMSISPVLSLYVREIMPKGSAITLFSGIVAAIPGVATLFAAPQLGRLGDRIGTELILSIGFVFAILVYLPMAFVTNVWQLMFLRFLIGISNATMLPAVQTILSKNTPPAVTGRVFSWNQSFQAIGSVLGPMIGSVVSTVFDYSGVFISTSILVLLNFLLVWHNTASLRRKHLNS